MRRVAAIIISALLALLWLPVTSHCLLESFGAIPEFLHCAEVCTPIDADHSDDADVCASLETASYKTEQYPVFVKGPRLVPVPLLVLFEPAPASQILFSSNDDPSRWVTWQFVLRAAAPPRAPSFLA